MPPRYFIGLDGGGTATSAAVADEKGEIIACLKGPSTNYHVVGPEAARENLLALLENLLTQAQTSQSRIGAACDQALVRSWLGEFGIEKKSRVTHDAVIALTGGTLSDTGLLVISGTGSIFFGRGLDGQTHRVGGWGPLLADEGSGYHLGREALRAMMRSYDGYQPETLLTKLILADLNLERPPQLVKWSTTQGQSKDKVACLGKHVFEAARRKDFTAMSIIEKLTDQMAEMTSLLARSMPLPEKYIVALSGGNFKHELIYFEKTRVKIEKALPGAQACRPKAEPLIGALLIALADAGIPGSDSLIDRLQTTYRG